MSEDKPITAQEWLELNAVPIPEAGCWLWTGTSDGGAYGQVTRQYKRDRAHRVSDEKFYGPIPAGLFVCHRCDTPMCINPKHLFAGPPVANTHDMVKKGRKYIPPLKTHCKRGHEKIYNPAQRRYRCKICNAARSRNYYWSHHEKALLRARRLRPAR